MAEYDIQGKSVVEKKRLPKFLLMLSSATSSNDLVDEQVQRRAVDLNPHVLPANQWAKHKSIQQWCCSLESWQSYEWEEINACSFIIQLSRDVLRIRLYTYTCCRGPGNAYCSRSHRVVGRSNQVTRSWFVYQYIGTNIARYQPEMR